MFTLEDEIQPEVRRVEIKLGESSLTLVMRPVTDDERVKDSALQTKFVVEDDPDKAAAFYAARDALKKSVVIGWEGIQTTEGKLIPFTAKNFQRLLTAKAVRSLVIDAVTDHFNNRIKDEKLGELPEPLPVSSQDGSKEANGSQQSQESTSGESQQDGSPKD